ncbi:hypothetical protein V8G54_032517 [Vigna mungo]|uniref:Uncharacterized protein n=1 Tax=Vigna mungo TaxID=3915 RepID=A0AAQ3ML93_VIGMU
MATIIKVAISPKSRNRNLDLHSNLHSRASTMNHPNRALHRQRDNPCRRCAKLQGRHLLQPTENHNEIQKNPKSKKPRIGPLLASTDHHECFLIQLGSSSSCYHELYNSRNHPPLKQSEQRFPSFRDEV